MPDDYLNIDRIRVDHLVARTCQIFALSLLACLLLAMSACSLIPPKATPNTTVEVPTMWSSANVTTKSSASSLATWWLRFNDPVLINLVTQALQANTSVNSAQAALRQARALRDVAAAGLLPSLGISASAQRSTAGSSNSTSTNSFKTGLDASWEIDIFGANRSALNASEATAQASEASLGDVQVSIAAETALNYITLRGAQTRLAIAEHNLTIQLETLQITQWRQQAGLISELEVEQARASTEQTRALIPIIQTNIQQTRHALAVLTGQPPASLLSVLEAASPIPQAANDLAFSTPADTLRQRPDVRAAEHQVTAAMARVTQADAERMPNFKLGGSLGLNALTLGALGNGSAVVSMLLAGVTMPIFDGGAGIAQVKAQQAALDQARFNYKAVILTALKDVENALVALRGDRERLSRLQLAADAASNAALMARQRFDSGIVDFQVVLDTQRTQFTTQEGVAGASIDVSADHVRLYKAFGGGWLPDTNSATEVSSEDTTKSSGL